MRITLRMPSDIHARLTAEAKHARRSLNSEIVHRLEATLTTAGQDTGSPGSGTATPAPAPAPPPASGRGRPQRGTPDSCPA
ncbi:Arc family DNA-binding protein [Kitasatospora sp. NPDC018058]|uniref:Arc family DNA-binding protein n=1 Tax=Kitasatospora sp. NPDC018058 TaxID=3364025 RepID=UPI0037BEAEE9